MPADIKKLNQDKDIILSHINTKGPSLPVHLAKAANLNMLFAAAFLSELYSEGKVKMSGMKIGSSSLYYLPGQEAQLENFIEFLNQKEKEAFYLLKKEQLLADDTQAPAIRVALRAIKDFAVPVNIKTDETQKLFWKYFLAPDSEIRAIVQEQISPKSKKQEKEKEENKEIESQSLLAEKAKIEEEEENPEKEKKQKAKKLQEESLFIKKIKEHLSKQNIELSTILEKKKELTAKIKINTIFGKQEFYLIAKDKKKISEDDLTISLQKAQTEKMPAIIMAPGDLDKKAIEHMKEWRNLIKFEKINL